MNSSSVRESRIYDLLTRTSRTFALAIPLLPAPTQLEVSVAYLLFRVADTIEDGRLLSRAEKLTALDHLHRLLSVGDFSVDDRTTWLPRPPCQDTDCLDLLDDLPLVLATAESLKPEVRSGILKSVCVSIAGMQEFLNAGGEAGELQLQTLDELRGYCYFVAGLVGEMLTDLFVEADPKLEAIRADLDQNSRWFGEGLQLVNILKDSEVDRAEGRCFIPSDVNRSRLFELAREDLAKATAYVSALRDANAPTGIVAFTDLPLQLAWRTLECVERSGPGSKVPREEVMSILNRSLSQLDRSNDAPVESREVATK